MRPRINKYSQYSEEVFLLEYFQNRVGLVVEIGAADGLNNSNSRRLIENGWSALLVEPNINNFNKIKSLYDLNENIIIENCGCSNESGLLEFYIDLNDEYQQLSTFNTQQVDKCKSMYNCEFIKKNVDVFKTSDIFDKHNINVIDFLSIDTESYDKNVIEGIDFDKFSIEIICVEDDEAVSLLKERGYDIIHKTVGNIILKYEKN